MLISLLKISPVNTTGSYKLNIELSETVILSLLAVTAVANVDAKPV